MQLIVKLLFFLLLTGPDQNFLYGKNFFKEHKCAISLFCGGIFLCTTSLTTAYFIHARKLENDQKNFLLNLQKNLEDSSNQKDELYLLQQYYSILNSMIEDTLLDNQKKIAALKSANENTVAKNTIILQGLQKEKNNLDKEMTAMKALITQNANEIFEIKNKISDLTNKKTSLETALEANLENLENQLNKKNNAILEQLAIEKKTMDQNNILHNQIIQETRKLDTLINEQTIVISDLNKMTFDLDERKKNLEQEKADIINITTPQLQKDLEKELQKTGDLERNLELIIQQGKKNEQKNLQKIQISKNEQFSPLIKDLPNISPKNFLIIDRKNFADALSFTYAEENGRKITFSILEYLMKTKNYNETVYTNKSPNFKKDLLDSFSIGVESTNDIILSDFFLHLLEYSVNQRTKYLKDNGCSCMQKYMKMTEDFYEKASNRFIPLYLIADTEKRIAFLYPPTDNLNNYLNQLNKNNPNPPPRFVPLLYLPEIHLQPYSWMPDFATYPNNYYEISNKCKENGCQFVHCSQDMDNPNSAETVLGQSYTSFRNEIPLDKDNTLDNVWTNITNFFFNNNQDLYEILFDICNSHMICDFYDANCPHTQRIEIKMTDNHSGYFNPIGLILEMLMQNQFRSDICLSIENTGDWINKLHSALGNTARYTNIFNFLQGIMMISVQDSIRELTNNSLQIKFNMGNHEASFSPFYNSVIFKYTYELVRDLGILKLINTSDLVHLTKVSKWVTQLQLLSPEYIVGHTTYKDKKSFHLSHHSLAQPMGEFAPCCKKSMQKNFVGLLSISQNNCTNNDFAEKFSYTVTKDKYFLKNCTEDNSNFFYQYNKNEIINRNILIDPPGYSRYSDSFKKRFEPIKDSFSHFFEYHPHIENYHKNGIWYLLNNIFYCYDQRESYQSAFCPFINIVNYCDDENHKSAARPSQLAVNTDTLLLIQFGSLCDQQLQNITTTGGHSHTASNERLSMFFNIFFKEIFCQIPPRMHAASREEKALTAFSEFTSQYSEILATVTGKNNEGNSIRGIQQLPLVLFGLNKKTRTLYPDQVIRKFFLLPHPASLFGYAFYQSLQQGTLVSTLENMRNFFKEGGENQQKDLFDSIRQEDQNLPYSSSHREGFFTGDLPYAFKTISNEVITNECIRFAENLNNPTNQPANIHNLINRTPYALFRKMLPGKGKEGKCAFLSNGNVYGFLSKKLIIKDIINTDELKILFRELFTTSGKGEEKQHTPNLQNIATFIENIKTTFKNDESLTNYRYLIDLIDENIRNSMPFKQRLTLAYKKSGERFFNSGNIFLRGWLTAFTDSLNEKKQNFSAYFADFYTDVITLTQIELLLLSMAHLSRYDQIIDYDDPVCKSRYKKISMILNALMNALLDKHLPFLTHEVCPLNNKQEFKPPVRFFYFFLQDILGLLSLDATYNRTDHNFSANDNERMEECNKLLQTFEHNPYNTANSFRQILLMKENTKGTTVFSDSHGHPSHLHFEKNQCTINHADHSDKHFLIPANSNSSAENNLYPLVIGKFNALVASMLHILSLLFPNKMKHFSVTSNHDQTHNYSDAKGKYFKNVLFSNESFPYPRGDIVTLFTCGLFHAGMGGSIIEEKTGPRERPFYKRTNVVIQDPKNTGGPDDIIIKNYNNNTMQNINIHEVILSKAFANLANKVIFNTISFPVAIIEYNEKDGGNCKVYQHSIFPPYSLEDATVKGKFIEEIKKAKNHLSQQTNDSLRITFIDHHPYSNNQYIKDEFNYRENLGEHYAHYPIGSGIPTDGISAIGMEDPQQLFSNSTISAELFIKIIYPEFKNMVLKGLQLNSTKNFMIISGHHQGPQTQMQMEFFALNGMIQAVSPNNIDDLRCISDSYLTREKRNCRYATTGKNDDPGNIKNFSDAVIICPAMPNCGFNFQNRTSSQIEYPDGPDGRPTVFFIPQILIVNAYVFAKHGMVFPIIKFPNGTIQVNPFIQSLKKSFSNIVKRLQRKN